MADEEWRQSILAAYGELARDVRAFQAQIESAIAEYKKTVNTAIAILGQEAIAFQSETKQRIAQDAADRIARQRRTDRKDIAVLTALGCLIVANALAIGATIVAVAWFISTRAAG